MAPSDGRRPIRRLVEIKADCNQLSNCATPHPANVVIGTPDPLDSVPCSSCFGHKQQTRMRDRIMGRKTMRAHRTWKVVGAENHSPSIENLQLDLSAINRCIGVLKKTDANPDD